MMQSISQCAPIAEHDMAYAKLNPMYEYVKGADTKPKNLPADKGRSRSSSKGAEVDEDGYVPFSIPWSLSLSYGVTLREDINPSSFHERPDGTGWYGYKITQNLNISGNVKLSNKWNMNFSSGWDFIDHEFTTTTMNISRDLHCFSMSCGVVLSPYMSYNFSFRANSSMLADALKYDQRSSASRNADWY